MSSREQWIFGYGSLVWRPAFDYLERLPAYIRGYQRRFWQASPDHRGSEKAPGRVVTLIESPGAQLWGTAYRVCHSVAADVLETLDHRERAGYVRRTERLYTDASGEGAIDEVLLYLAGPDNPNFLGPTGNDKLASVIAVAHGPSGSNREYLVRLHQALHQMGRPDPHVDDLVAALQALDAGQNRAAPV